MKRVFGAALVALVLFGATLKVPLFESNADYETIGTVQYCGFPFPWIQYADGISIPGALGMAKWWLLPVNLACWALVSGFVFRLRTLRNFTVCLAIAQAPLLLLFLSLL